MRTLVVAGPIAAAVLTVVLIWSALRSAGVGSGPLVTLLSAAAAGAVVGVGAWAGGRRLRPLAALLDLDLWFPGRAPGRWRVAQLAAESGGREQTVDLLPMIGQYNLDIAVKDVMVRYAMATQASMRPSEHLMQVRMLATLVAAQMGVSELERDRMEWALLMREAGMVAPGPDDALAAWLGSYVELVTGPLARPDDGSALGYRTAAADAVAVADTYLTIAATPPGRSRLTTGQIGRRMRSLSGRPLPSDAVDALLTLPHRYRGQPTTGGPRISGPIVRPALAVSALIVVVMLAATAVTPAPVPPAPDSELPIVSSADGSADDAADAGLTLQDGDPPAVPVAAVEPSPAAGGAAGSPSAVGGVLIPVSGSTGGQWSPDSFSGSYIAAVTGGVGSAPPRRVASGGKTSDSRPVAEADPPPGKKPPGDADSDPAPAPTPPPPADPDPSPPSNPGPSPAPDPGPPPADPDPEPPPPPAEPDPQPPPPDPEPEPPPPEPDPEPPPPEPDPEPAPPEPEPATPPADPAPSPGPGSTS